MFDLRKMVNSNMTPREMRELQIRNVLDTKYSITEGQVFRMRPDHEVVVGDKTYEVMQGANGKFKTTENIIILGSQKAELRLNEEI